MPVLDHAQVQAAGEMLDLIAESLYRIQSDLDNDVLLTYEGSGHTAYSLGASRRSTDPGPESAAAPRIGS